MARYTLVYGVRLIPEGTLKGVDEATLNEATRRAYEIIGRPGEFPHG